MTKKYHPDINPTSLKKYKEINEAYSILSDKAKRQEYDMKSAGGYSGFGSSSTQSRNYGNQRQNQYQSNRYSNSRQDPFENFYYGFQNNAYSNRVSFDLILF